MKSLQTPLHQLGPWHSRHSRATIAVLFLLAVSSLSAGPFVWTTKTPNSLVRFEAVGGAAGSKLYQFSGFYTLRPSILATTQCDAYDPATDIWTSLPTIPQAVTHCGQVADTDNANNQIFWLVGGFLGNHPGPTTNQVWKYSITNKTWAAGPPLPAPRAAGALVKLGRELHYFGGTIRTGGSSWTDYGTHWAFDLDSGTAWRATTPGGQQLLASMPNPRNHMGGVALNGKLYAIGGQHQGQQSTAPQNEVDVYDPATNTWTQAAPMPRPIGHVTANVFARNGLLVVVSGLTTNSVPIANVIEYDPSTNTWSELPPLPSGRQSPVSGLVGDQIVATCGLKGSLQAQTWVTNATTTAGTWHTGAPLPIAAGEVASGVINNVLYVLGAATNATMAYDLSTGIWRSDLAPRPILGDHHGAEVINGKLYLFGGLNGGGAAAGRVQIYNPVTNSWSLGASAPYAAGSVATALIGGKVYMAGGIVGSTTVGTAAVYDPASDTWASIASMPAGRNHAAASTDGQKLYIFGGRIGGNVPSVGFNDVQIYDPASNTWQWSGQTGSTIPPLPQPRGGMGKAAFYGNEFYVMGGETTNAGTGQVAGNVYKRVDVYNPVSQTWRLETPMPTARHGIFPVVGDGKILVAGGGVHSGNSSSNVFEIFSTSSPTPTPTPTPTQAVISFTLINADTDQPVPGYEVLNDGAVINSASLPTTHLNIRANTSPAIVGSVRFGFDGNANARIESAAPYALFSDVSGNYNAGTLSTGGHTLTGTPYTNKSATGTAGTSLMISFTVQ
jgi:N-acetylneuraminic acid mutarotase